MSHHTLSPTTHTTELRQIAELNGRITGADGKQITAGALRMAGVPIDTVMIEATGAPSGRPAVLPADAIVQRIVGEGPPSYPYVYGLFGADRANSPELRAPLHTAHLRMLSKRYGLRHSWGV